MMRTVFADLKRAFCQPLFFLAVAGCALSLLCGGLGGLADTLHNIKPGYMPDGYHLSFFSECLSSEAFFLALPILSAVPYTVSYLKDMQSGFVKAYLPRSGKKAYSVGKLVSCGLSGGSVPVLGTALFFLAETAFLRSGISASFSFPGHFGDRFVLLFLFGVFCSLFGMTVSGALKCGYLAPLSPFMLFYLLLILRERYLKNAYYLDMREWMDPDPEKWFWGGFTPGILLIILIGICAAVFYCMSERRLTDL